jgi:hypothetical protein
MRRTLLAVLVLLVFPVAARAAGETTHSWMAERAVEYVKDPQLEALLRAHVLELQSGAAYPDTGYWVDGYVPDSLSKDFGEESHWEPFVNDYVAHVRAKRCPALAHPLGPCAPLVAHLMGVAAHGMGDEVWDWLFEPRVTDFGEDAAYNFFGPGNPGEPLDSSRLPTGNPLDDVSSSIEYAMDEVAISEHGRWLSPNTSPPPVADLVEVYRRRHGEVRPEHIVAGHTASSAAMALERAVAPEEGPRIHDKDMPRSSAAFVTAPGGVDFSARTIAGYYDAVWRKLIAPASAVPKVVAVYPPPGGRDVPLAWQPARTAPGPATGGADNRVWAALGHAIHPATLTAETFTVLGPDGQRIEPLAGFPRLGPWGSYGTHSALWYPAGDLAACTRYTAVLGTGIRDLDGRPLAAEKRWSFTTAGCP